MTALADSDEIWGEIQLIQITQHACVALAASNFTLLPQSCKQ